MSNGAIFADWGASGGGAYWSTLNNCTLTGNRAKGFGGGAQWCTLTNCVIVDNWAGSAGGGVVSSTLFNCLIAANSAASLLSANDGGGGGGAYYSTLNNCTVTGNSAGGAGGGVYGGVLTNCTVYYNTATNGANYYHYPGSSADIELHYTCTYPMPTNGVGNITNAPLFVDTNNWADLRLRPDSPCIDAGNNDIVTGDTDLDGNPRIINGIVDMGAYEFVPPTPADLVQQLIDLVNESDLRHKRLLLASLEAALASIQRGNRHSAVGQLGGIPEQSEGTGISAQRSTGDGTH